MALDIKKWGEGTSITSCESSSWKGRQGGDRCLGEAREKLWKNLTALLLVSPS